MKLNVTFWLASSALVLGAGCGSSSSDKDDAAGGNSGGSPVYTQPGSLAGSLALASESLENAIPNPSAAAAALRHAMALTVGEFDSFDVGYNPGGACVDDNDTPKSYLGKVLDPEYDCDDFTPTVFARFKEEIQIVELLSAELEFEDNRIVAGEFSITTTWEEGDMVAKLVLSGETSDLDSDEFDTRIVVSGSFRDPDTDEESRSFEGQEVFFRSRGNIINLLMYEDDRELSLALVDGDGGGDNEPGPALRWSHFYLNTQTGETRYEYNSVQEGGASLESNMLLVDANGAGFLFHAYSANVRDNDSGSEVPATSYYAIEAPQGKDSESMTVTTHHTAGDGYQAVVCVDAEELDATEDACAEDEGFSLTAWDALADLYTWDNRDDLWENVVKAGGELKDRTHHFTNKDSFFSVRE